MSDTTIDLANKAQAFEERKWSAEAAAPASPIATQEPVEVIARNIVRQLPWTPIEEYWGTQEKAGIRLIAGALHDELSASEKRNEELVRERDAQADLLRRMDALVASLKAENERLTEAGEHAAMALDNFMVATVDGMTVTLSWTSTLRD